MNNKQNDVHIQIAILLLYVQLYIVLYLFTLFFRGPVPKVVMLLPVLCLGITHGGAQATICSVGDQISDSYVRQGPFPQYYLRILSNDFRVTFYLKWLALNQTKLKYNVKFISRRKVRKKIHTLCTNNFHMKMGQPTGYWKCQLDHSSHCYYVSIQIVIQGALLMIFRDKPKLSPSSII